MQDVYFKSTLPRTVREVLALSVLGACVEGRPAGCGSKPMGSQSISAGIGMFTGGTIWLLTHGQLWLEGSLCGANVQEFGKTAPLLPALPRPNVTSEEPDV